MICCAQGFITWSTTNVLQMQRLETRVTSLVCSCSLAFLCSVLVLKKLGSDLFEEMIEVINYLGKVEGMRVIVEPQEFEALVQCPPTSHCASVADQRAKFCANASSQMCPALWL